MKYHVGPQFCAFGTQTNSSCKANRTNEKISAMAAPITINPMLPDLSIRIWIVND